jgi:hypothetical protein
MIIKKLLILIIFIYFIILFTHLSFAGNKAYIYITIIDAPPKILNIEVKPNPAYTNSEILCEANVKDENMSLLNIKYEWFVNNKLIVKNNKFLQATLKAGDVIKCKITATDVYGKVSEAISQSTMIQPHGIVEITGYVVRSAFKSSQTTKGLASAITLVGVIFILSLSVKKFNKR